MLGLFRSYSDISFWFFLGSNSGNDDWSISMNGSASMSKKPLFGSNSLRKASHHKSDFDGPRMAKQLRHSTKLKIGDATDDIHVCIMCLRAIMNNKFGFNMVIGHEQAINCIALSLVINSSTIFSNPFWNLMVHFFLLSETQKSSNKSTCTWTIGCHLPGQRGPWYHFESMWLC